MSRSPASPAALVRFALDRLPSMQRSDGAFCNQVALPDLAPEGRSLRYTLIVLLGLLRAREAGVEHPFDCDRLHALLREEMDSPDLSAGDLGLLLWAEARQGRGADEAVLDRLEARLLGQGGLARLDGMELSWILIGVTEALAEAASERAAELFDAALAEQLRRGVTGSGLFLHRGKGRRQDFPNFATAIYGVLALARASRRAGDEEPLRAAARATEVLLRLQRPDGGWPWLYDAQRGVVIEPYEIYSVHQDAMAPMALYELSDASGQIRYREAALGGLRWMGGENDLNRPMLDEEVGMAYRSIRRRRPFARGVLYLNTATAYVSRPALARMRGPLELNPTDRPYHLGWVLEAWAGRVGT